jgi:hypothetical protein
MEIGCHVMHVVDIKGVNRSLKSNKTPICVVKGSYFINAIFIICLYPQFKSSDICIAVGVTSGVRSDSPSKASELTPGF